MSEANRIFIAPGKNASYSLTKLVEDLCGKGDGTIGILERKRCDARARSVDGIEFPAVAREFQGEVCLASGREERHLSPSFQNGHLLVAELAERRLRICDMEKEDA